MSANLLAQKANSDPLSVFKNSSFNVRPLKANINEVSISEINVKQAGIIEDGLSTISPTKISKSQIRAREIDVTHIGIPKVSIFENSISNTAKGRGAAYTITPTEINSFEVNSTEVSSIQVDSSQHSIAEIDSIQVNSGKVALSSSVSLQQFLGSHLPTHNLTSNLLSKLKYTATDIWSELLQHERLFNITFQVTNFPNGQLAEAQITSFDASGMPSAGTIFIDDDANGKG